MPLSLHYQRFSGSDRYDPSSAPQVARLVPSDLTYVVCSMARRISGSLCFLGARPASGFQQLVLETTINPALRVRSTDSQLSPTPTRDAPSSLR